MKIIKLLAIISTLTTAALSADFAGTVTNIQRVTEWEQDRYGFSVLVDHELGASQWFWIGTDVAALASPTFAVGDHVLVSDERPGQSLPQARFVLSFASGSVYEATSSMVELTRQDYGLVGENDYMITNVQTTTDSTTGKQSYRVNLDDGQVLTAEALPEGTPVDALVGVIVRKTDEQFVPNNPGYSVFSYYAEELDLELYTTAMSEKSHWVPTESDLGRLVEVKSFTQDRCGATITRSYFTLSDGFSFVADWQIVKWIAVGDVWMKIEDAPDIMISVTDGRVLQKVEGRYRGALPRIHQDRWVKKTW